MAKAIEKKTLNLRAGDWDYLESIYGPKGVPTSHVVRKLVSKVVDAYKARELPLPTEDIDINLEV